MSLSLVLTTRSDKTEGLYYLNPYKRTEKFGIRGEDMLPVLLVWTFLRTLLLVDCRWTFRVPSPDGTLFDNYLQ